MEVIGILKNITDYSGGIFLIRHRSPSNSRFDDCSLYFFSRICYNWCPIEENRMVSLRPRV